MTWTENHGFSTFGNYNLSLLGIDQAWLNISNLFSKTLWLYERSSDCFECPFIQTKVFNDAISLEPGESLEIKVPTKFPIMYKLHENGNSEFIIPPNDDEHCEIKADSNFGEFGIYEVHATENGCDTVTVLQPVSIYLPFLIPIIFYISMALLSFVINKYRAPICRMLRLGDIFCKNKAEESTSTDVSSASTRLRSLDTFRGICIVIMMFVHFGSGGYYFLEHATWDGLYVADLVFPWFLWIMGVCIPVSIKSQVKRNTPKVTILRRIIVRSLKLIAIGIILNSKGGPVEFTTLRFPGVLQRFGLCYFVAASSVLICASEDFVKNHISDKKYIALVQDVVFIWKGWIITLVSITLHACLTFFLKVPGCPTGYLGPGGLHENNAYPGNCIGGAAGYIDRQVLTLKHIYQWPTAMTTYKSAPYDPEGLLGTLTSILTVWLGVQAGMTLQVYQNNRSRLIRWATWAIILGAVGAALCGGKQTGGVIPLNKNLWSLSFVLVLSCFALILLIMLYVTIDMLKIWSGTPFCEPGMNSILLYIAHLVASIDIKTKDISCPC